MHLLIDTNIFIYREDDRIVSQNVGDLFALLQKIPVDVLIHPSSLADIQRDTDGRRRDVMLSKIGIYRQLPSPPSAACDEDLSGLSEARNHRRTGLIMKFSTQSSVELSIFC